MIPVNSSQTETDFQPWELYMSSAIISVLDVIGVVLNAVHLSTYQTWTKCTVDTAFSINLAISDILLNCVAFPLITNWFKPSVTMCRMTMIVTLTFGWSSIHSLLALYFERYMKICHPYKYQDVLTKKFIIAAIIYTWISAISTSVLVAMAYIGDTETIGPRCVVPLLKFSWNIRIFIDIYAVTVNFAFAFISLKVYMTMREQKRKISVRIIRI